jgi:uracil phosphoribosyltransferase
LIDIEGGEIYELSRYVFILIFSPDVTTLPVDFVRYSKRSMRLLAEDAIAEFPTKVIKSIITPCGSCTGTQRCISLLPDGRLPSSSSPSTVWDATNLCAVSIVRSGDSLLEIVREIEPSCKVGKILIQRDEKSIEKYPILIYEKLPLDIRNMYVLLCDPMLATGGSAIKALDVLCKEHQVNPHKIIFANLICCPEGLKALAKSYPDVTIVTVKIDDCLNDDKYIVPGLGDFGDRYFNTI